MRLERAGVSYMITGGVASTIYGDPRFTRDIDIVLELSPAEVPRLVSAFGGKEYYVPPHESLRREAARDRGGHFNIIHRDTALRADAYVRGEDPLHAWAFERRVRMELEETSIWVAPVEYVILRKLEYFRTSESERHLRDAALILRISRDIIDEEQLEGWVIRLGLQEELEAARGYAP